ncbi:MAG: hypothetical protein ACFFFG_04045 [Candidatus Thorarchaeota archaeon]
MASNKERLKLHYDQQKRIIEQLRSMRNELNQEQRSATRFRKVRDKYKTERQTLLAKATPEVESRDSQRTVVESLRKRRDFLRRQAQPDSGQVFSLLSDSQLERLTLVELKFHLYELEFKQQTTTLSQEDEGILIDEIKRIEDRIALLEKRDQAIVAEYLDEVPETKEKIEQEIREIETKLAQEESVRRETSQKISELYERIQPLKDEEDKAHQNFVAHLQRVEALKVEITTKQEELDSLKGKISKVKKLIAEEEHQERFGEIEKKIQELLRKRDRGEDLSPDEQEFLMGYGYAPF